jgi:hypothetical protein
MPCWHTHRSRRQLVLQAQYQCQQRSRWRHGGQYHCAGRFNPLETISPRPASSASGGAHFGDVSGAGKLDLIQTAPGSWGYFERTSDDGWTSLETFSTFPNLDTKNADVKFVDLTGDGLADVLIYADQIYYWYPSSVRVATDRDRPRLNRTARRVDRFTSTLIRNRQSVLWTCREMVSQT